MVCGDVNEGAEITLSKEDARLLLSNFLNAVKPL